MCGRYVTISKVKAVEKRFNASMREPERYVESANIATGDWAPVITNDHPKEIQWLRFGFTPAWAKKQMYVINARSEGDHNPENDPNYRGAKGILQKPMFRKSIRERRCLVLADAFIEGPEKTKLNNPFLVYMRNGKRPFAFAGIWDEWVNVETGEIIPSFAIITTVSNAVTQKIGHHRSPVILSEDQEGDWLSHDMPLGSITEMLEPYPASELNAYPIDSAIKNPRVKDLELLKPVGERVFKEYDYELYDELKLEGMGMTRARQRKNNEH